MKFRVNYKYILNIVIKKLIGIYLVVGDRRIR